MSDKRVPPNPDYGFAVQQVTAEHEPTRRPTRNPRAIALNILYVLGILLFGYFSIEGFRANATAGEEISSLKADGVETNAEVLDVYTAQRKGRILYHELDISFQPEGSAAISDNVLDCEEARWAPSMTSVDVVYLPDDPEVVRLAGCVAPGGVITWVIPIAFGSAALFMLWRAPRRFRGT